MKVLELNVNEIEQNENSRVVYKTADMSDLMQSMRKDGLLQPIGVRKTESDTWECVYGNRRLLAAKKLEWVTIPCVLSETETEQERDFVGLIENMKRKNTTVTEDGRLFDSLIRRGLSISEIAARLDIREDRIKMSVDCFREVPAEFAKKVVYTQGGGNMGKKPKDRIAASIAVAILNTARGAGLNRAQRRAMFAYASDNTPTMDQIKKIGPMVKGGASVEEAISRVDGLEKINVTVYISTRNLVELEDKYNTKIHDILYGYLRDNKEFKVENHKIGLSQLAKKAEIKLSKKSTKLIPTGNGEYYAV